MGGKCHVPAPAQVPTPLSGLDSSSALGPGAQPGGRGGSCASRGRVCCPVPGRRSQPVGGAEGLGPEVGQGGIDGVSKMLGFNNPHTVDCASICISQHITEQALAGFWSPLC